MSATPEDPSGDAVARDALLGGIALCLVQASGAGAENAPADPELLHMLGALIAAEAVDVDVDRAIDDRLLDAADAAMEPEGMTAHANEKPENRR